MKHQMRSRRSPVPFDRQTSQSSDLKRASLDYGPIGNCSGTNRLAVGFLFAFRGFFSDIPAVSFIRFVLCK